MRSSARLHRKAIRGPPDRDAPVDTPSGDAQTCAASTVVTRSDRAAPHTSKRQVESDAVAIQHAFAQLTAHLPSISIAFDDEGAAYADAHGDASDRAAARKKPRVESAQAAQAAQAAQHRRDLALAAEEAATQQRLADDAARQRLAATAEALKQQRLADETEKQRLDANAAAAAAAAIAAQHRRDLALAAEEMATQQRQNDDAARQRLAAKADALKQQRLADETEKQRLDAEAAAAAATVVAAQHRRDLALAVEEAATQQRLTDDAARQRLAATAEALKQQRLADETEKQRMDADVATATAIMVAAQHRQRLALATEETAIQQRLTDDATRQKLLAKADALKQQRLVEEAEEQRLVAEAAAAQQHRLVLDAEKTRLLREAEVKSAHLESERILIDTLEHERNWVNDERPKRDAHIHAVATTTARSAAEAPAVPAVETPTFAAAAAEPQVVKSPPMVEAHAMPVVEAPTVLVVEPPTSAAAAVEAPAVHVADPPTSATAAAEPHLVKPPPPPPPPVTAAATIAVPPAAAGMMAVGPATDALSSLPYYYYTPVSPFDENVGDCDDEEDESDSPLLASAAAHSDVACNPPSVSNGPSIDGNIDDHEDEQGDEDDEGDEEEEEEDESPSSSSAAQTMVEDTFTSSVTGTTDALVWSSATSMEIESDSSPTDRDGQLDTITEEEEEEEEERSLSAASVAAGSAAAAHASGVPSVGSAATEVGSSYDHRLVQAIAYLLKKSQGGPSAKVTRKTFDVQCAYNAVLAAQRKLVAITATATKAAAADAKAALEAGAPKTGGGGGGGGGAGGQKQMLPTPPAVRKATNALYDAQQNHRVAKATLNRSILRRRKRREDRLFLAVLAYRPGVTEASVKAVPPPDERCNIPLHARTRHEMDVVRATPLYGAHIKLQKVGLFDALADITNEADLHILLRAYGDRSTEDISVCDRCDRITARFTYAIFPRLARPGVKREWKLCTETCAAFDPTTNERLESEVDE